MLKSFPGEAPELDSLNAQRGRSQTKTAPGCHVFRLLDEQAKDKGHYPESRFRPAPHSPVDAGDCPERKQKRRTPMSKTFPGEASELDSLTAQSGRKSHKDGSRMSCLSLLDRKAKD